MTTEAHALSLQITTPRALSPVELRRIERAAAQAAAAELAAVCALPPTAVAVAPPRPTSDATSYDRDGRGRAVVVNGMRYTPADIAALAELYALCVVCKDALATAARTRGVQAREHATQRADRAWRDVAITLETMGLNIPAPGEAVAARLEALRTERDTAVATIRDARSILAGAFEHDPPLDGPQIWEIVRRTVAVLRSDL